MSFFTCAGLARFALQRGNLKLWNVALQWSGKGNLAPAEQLANAAASPNTGAWPMVSTIFDNALSDPVAISEALYRSVEQDNLLLMQELLIKWHATYDADRLLQAMAQHGAVECWFYAITGMKLVASEKSHNALVDAAITGGNERILDGLQNTMSLASEYRARIRSKRELDDQMLGRNIHYIQNVIMNAEWLKSSDYDAAQAFSRRMKSGYMMEFIHRKMDEADAKWAKYVQKHVPKVDDIHHLKHAA